MTQMTMPPADVFVTATEFAAHGLQLPQAWRNLLDQDTLEALDEIRKANTDDYHFNTVVIGKSKLNDPAGAILRTEDV